MKKFFDRLRRWLIKKLGGYAEQRQVLQVVRRENVQTHRIVEEMSVGMQAGGAVDIKRYCENQLLERLVRDLHQSGLVLWESKLDPIRQEMDVRATVCVIIAKDIVPHTKRWVE